MGRKGSLLAEGPTSRFSLLQSLKKNDPLADAHLSPFQSLETISETLPMLSFHHCGLWA